MKILFLNTLDDPRQGGGAEFTIWALIQGLVARGHECAILATSDQKGLHKSERDGIRVWRAGIKNLYWPSMLEKRPAFLRTIWHSMDVYNVMMQPFLREVLRIECPDVVSVHNLPGWSCAVWKTLNNLGIPAIQVLHDQYTLCPKVTMFDKGNVCERQCVACSLLRIPHRHLSNRVSALVGVSNFILDRHLRFGYFSHVPIKAVIHDARSPSILSTDIKSEPHEGLRVGFIGRLDETKGIHVLLQAFIEYDNPSAELWIAGNGTSGYVDNLKLQFKDHRIKYLGRVKPGFFYPNIDFSVVPSLWHDTFPGVVFEAFAFAKTVIASKRGGIPEMIRHGYNGFLFDPQKPSELLDCLRILGDDKDRRILMGENARNSAQPLLDVSAWVSRYLNVYERAIQISHNGTLKTKGIKL
jgi:glycosyltransferase involved in cell wall biosynthesis